MALSASRCAASRPLGRLPAMRGSLTRSLRCSSDEAWKPSTTSALSCTPAAVMQMSASVGIAVASDSASSRSSSLARRAASASALTPHLRAHSRCEGRERLVDVERAAIVRPVHAHGRLESGDRCGDGSTAASAIAARGQRRGCARNLAPRWRCGVAAPRLRRRSARLGQLDGGDGEGRSSGGGGVRRRMWP